MPSLTQLDEVIAERQASLDTLKAMREAQAAASSDTAILRNTALAVHSLQRPDGDAAFAAETNDDADTLWAMPEHAFWVKLAREAILSGAFAPISAIG